MAQQPRIPPLREDELDDRARELLAHLGLPEGEVLNIFTTLVRHPRLFRRWLPLGGVLLTGTLPARDREILILRTAHRCDAAYEWAHHVEIGAGVGLDPDEIGRIQEGPNHPGWPSFDATLVRAVDELHEESRLSDSTWAELADRYDDQQLIEVTMLVGQYHLVAFALNSLGVQLEDGLDGNPNADET